MRLVSTGAWQTDKSPSSASGALTLGQWLVWRRAQDTDLLVAVRQMLEDFEAGRIALIERDIGGYVQH